jgi:hypothetical protein
MFAVVRPHRRGSLGLSRVAAGSSGAIQIKIHGRHNYEPSTHSKGNLRLREGSVQSGPVIGSTSRPGTT